MPVLQLLVFGYTRGTQAARCHAYDPCVVDSVYRELACVLWLVAPEELNVAGSSMIALSFQGLNILHAQVVCQALGSVDALVRLELETDVLAGLCFVICWWGRAICFWRRAAPDKLVEILHTGHRKVGQVALLEVVIDNPHLLWVLDGQALARLTCRLRLPAPSPRTSLRTSSSFATSGPGIVTMMFCFRVSLGR